jgi:hypothetical protein
VDTARALSAPAAVWELAGYDQIGHVEGTGWYACHKDAADTDAIEADSPGELDVKIRQDWQRRQREAGDPGCLFLVREDAHAELVRLRTDLRISLALAAPGSAVAVPAERQLRAIVSVLAAREHESTPSGDWQHRENPLGAGPAEDAGWTCACRLVRLVAVRSAAAARHGSVRRGNVPGRERPRMVRGTGAGSGAWLARCWPPGCPG